MPDFTREEFQNMIPSNCKVIRVTLPSRGNVCKGYGFIDVGSENDKECIIKYFDGKPYRHMILHANSKNNFYFNIMYKFIKFIFIINSN